MNILVLLASCAVLGLVWADGEGYYGNKYDNIDLDAILNNDRVLNNYIKCFLDKGPCTPEGRDGKKIMREVVQTACKKCNKNQATIMRKSLKAVRRKRKPEWELFVDKYDPGRKNYDKLLTFLEE